MKQVSRTGNALVTRNYDKGTFVSTWDAGTAWSLQVTPGVSNNSGNRVDPNNWSYVVQERKAWRGKYINHSWSSGAWHTDEYEGNIAPNKFPAHVPWESDAPYNAALEKLNAKARGELDLGIALAEAGSTMRMVKSVSKVIDFARLSRLGGTKDLANGWLQWQYGWKPLVSDVFLAADEAIRVVLNELQSIRARATIPIEVNREHRREIITTNPLTPTVAKGKGKASCTIGVRYQVPRFDPARWSSLNPVSLAWELIPYSFVFDWFYDVGSWLRAMETGLYYGASFKSGWVSELYRYEAVENVKLPHNVVYSSVSRREWFPTTGSIRRIEFRRRVLTSWPLPRKPTFKVDLGAQRMISAAALLRQLLSR